MTDTLLELLSTNGGPALFAVLVVAALGIPFVPATLLLLATGAMAEDLGFSIPQMLAWGVAAAVTGDQLGYWIGRLARTPIRAQSDKRAALSRGLGAAEKMMHDKGTLSVFLTRWLITPAGPYVNLVSGMLDFSWVKFTIAGVLGEVLWVTLYIYAGKLAGQSIEDLASIAGDVTWMVALGLAILVLVHQLMKSGKRADAAKAT